MTAIPGLRRLELLAEYRDDVFETFLSRFTRGLQCRSVVVRSRPRPESPAFGDAEVAAMRSALNYDVARIGITRGCQQVRAGTPDFWVREYAANALTSARERVPALEYSGFDRGRPSVGGLYDRYYRLQAESDSRMTSLARNYVGAVDSR